MQSSKKASCCVFSRRTSSKQAFAVTIEVTQSLAEARHTDAVILAINTLSPVRLRCRGHHHDPNLFYNTAVIAGLHRPPQQTRHLHRLAHTGAACCSTSWNDEPFSDRAFSKRTELPPPSERSSCLHVRICFHNARKGLVESFTPHTCSASLRKAKTSTLFMRAARTRRQCRQYPAQGRHKGLRALRKHCRILSARETDSKHFLADMRASLVRPTS